MTEEQTKTVLETLDGLIRSLTMIRGHALGGHPVRFKIAAVGDELAVLAQDIDGYDAPHADPILRPGLNKPTKAKASADV